MRILEYRRPDQDADTIPSWARVHPAAIATGACVALFMPHLLFMEHARWIVAGAACSVGVIGIALLLELLRRAPNAATLGACIGGVTSLFTAAQIMLMADVGSPIFYSGLLKTSHASALASAVVAVELCRSHGSALATLVMAMLVGAGMAVLQMGCICLVHPNAAWVAVLALVGVYLAFHLREKWVIRQEVVERSSADA